MEIEYGRYNLLTPAPKQQDVIESGHRVIFRMDEKVYQADIFPEMDTQHLRNEGIEESFKRKSEMDDSVERILLTDTTPVARSLLGKGRGALVMDGDVQVMEIMLSPFLIRKTE